MSQETCRDEITSSGGVSGLVASKARADREGPRVVPCPRPDQPRHNFGRGFLRNMTITVATLGFPRIGPRRELKSALEDHWAGKIDAAQLEAVAAKLRAKAWARQWALGCRHLPSNDFSLYDQMLDTSAMVGAVPARFGWAGGNVDLATYFAMARGSNGGNSEEGCTHGHARGTVPA